MESNLPRIFVTNSLINFAIPSSLFSVEIEYPWRDKRELQNITTALNTESVGWNTSLTSHPLGTCPHVQTPNGLQDPNILNPKTLVTIKISEGQIMCRCTIAQSNHTTA